MIQFPATGADCRGWPDAPTLPNHKDVSSKGSPAWFIATPALHAADDPARLLRQVILRGPGRLLRYLSTSTSDRSQCPAAFPFARKGSQRSGRRDRSGLNSLAT